MGAGYDTVFFWICECLAKDLPPNFVRDNLCYVEMDYDQVVNRKIEIINQNPE